MAGHADLFRSLVRLHPKAFRREYTDDLMQHFADLLADHGPARAWRRTAIDLAVTVPRYRPETLMNPRHANITLYTVTTVVVIAAVLSITAGLFPGGGSALLLAAAVLFVVSGSRLARATRTPDTNAAGTC